MDMEQARYNMVEQQIRTWDVLDQDVLDLLLKVRREDFVPEAHQALAFVDMEIPLGHGQSMWTPKLEARVIQELALRPTDRVLEIGTGSGYLAALLASQALEVVSVDIVPELLPPPRAHCARMASKTSRCTAATAPATGPTKPASTSSCSPVRPRCCRKPSAAVFTWAAACSRSRAKHRRCRRSS